MLEVQLDSSILEQETNMEDLTIVELIESSDNYEAQDEQINSGPPRLLRLIIFLMIYFFLSFFAFYFQK